MLQSHYRQIKASRLIRKTFAKGREVVSEFVKRSPCAFTNFFYRNKIALNKLFDNDSQPCRMCLKKSRL